MTHLFLISVIAFTFYTLITIFNFGIPKSYSDTYYLYKKEKLSFAFPIFLTIIAITLLPVMLEITEGNSLQFLSFFSCASVIFVAFAPKFKEKFQGKVHYISALVSIISLILWSIFAVKMWELLFMAFLITLSSSLLTKSLKRSWLFWLEFMGFITCYFTVIQLLWV